MTHWPHAVAFHEQLSHYNISPFRTLRCCSSLGWLRRLVSPVYFSRDAHGAVRQGIVGLPTDRPLLFVGE